MKLQNKTLSDLGLTSQSGANIVITGITNDSRKVCDGFLFAALPGVNSHGINFVSSAIQAGASAILTDKTGYSKYLSNSNTSNVVFVVVDPLSNGERWPSAKGLFLGALRILKIGRWETSFLRAWPW